MARMKGFLIEQEENLAEAVASAVGVFYSATAKVPTCLYVSLRPAVDGVAYRIHTRSGSPTPAQVFVTIVYDEDGEPDNARAIEKG